MEVYVDDMLVKSVNAEDHIGHLREMFGILRKYRMKHNPLKCTFGVALGKFLGYMVNQLLTGAIPSSRPSKEERDLSRLRSAKKPSKSSSIRKSDEFDLGLEKGSGAAPVYKFDISYKPRSSRKGQVLVDFVAKFAHIPEGMPEAKPQEVPTWKLYVDRSSGEVGAGAGILLVSPDSYNLNYAFRLEFNASNNTAEYEALLAGLRLALEMKEENSISVVIHS
ncbi:Uncharacterized protein Adt_27155 [Abeliophyllum distichum]|uniref:Reverse transcriptase domain-containing protein n=1 Tax=Abeliophyllum distichum TaxID=126358 RepID=A0ABD1RV04_9LAMI